jgi:hypothetical protein
MAISAPRSGSSPAGGAALSKAPPPAASPEQQAALALRLSLAPLAPTSVGWRLAVALFVVCARLALGAAGAVAWAVQVRAFS